MLSQYLSDSEIDDIVTAGFSRETGLRYTMDFLKSQTFDIAKMSIDEISEFVDAITHTRVRTNDVEFFKSMLESPPVGRRVHISITGLGNIAFVALNMPDKETRERAAVLFNRLRHEH